MSEMPPPALREEVARTLRPVQPLSSPGRRALALFPLGLAVSLVVLLVWGVREDAPQIGPLRLWGGTVLQIAVALVVMGAALAESMPGRLGSLRQVATRALLGLGFMVALTIVTFMASPTYVPPPLAGGYVRVCSLGSFSVGLVPLAAVGLMMLAGLTARPALAGAVAGLGAGLISDAGWRLYCRASDPAHVLTTHLGVIAALCVAGLLAGASLPMLQRLRRG
jgi:hypothetical protein